MGCEIIVGYSNQYRSEVIDWLHENVGSYGKGWYWPAYSPVNTIITGPVVNIVQESHAIAFLLTWGGK